MGKNKLKNERGAILINTARGGLVDDVALEKAVRTGMLSGAGLDVVEREPLSAQDELLHNPNIIVTPHIGGGTADLGDIIIPMLVNDILEIIRGRGTGTYCKQEIFPDDESTKGRMGMSEIARVLYDLGILSILLLLGVFPQEEGTLSAESLHTGFAVGRILRFDAGAADPRFICTFQPSYRRHDIKMAGMLVNIVLGVSFLARHRIKILERQHYLPLRWAVLPIRRRLWPDLS